MNARALRALIVFASVFVAMDVSQAIAQSCRWDGTGPFCDGACGTNETETNRLSINPGLTSSLGQSPPFGANCITGTKALCCNTPNRTCRWDGTAPFCDGECRSDETAAEPPPNSSGGQACLTGSKAFCCHSNVVTGSIRSPLEAAPQFTRYAAFWDKSSGPAWQARHGLSSARYQQEFDKLVGQGFRLVEISGYSVGDQDTYAAIWEQRPGPAWQARHGLTSAQYQQEFDRLASQGFRPIVISGYTVAGQDRYAAIWEQQQQGGPAWQARHGLTSAQYQQEFDKLASQGFRLLDVSGYSVGGEDRYAAIWEQQQQGGPAWQARHGMNSEQYQQEFNTLSQQQFRLTRIRGWRSGDTTHFAAIWQKVDGPAWVARHGMLSNAYQEEFNTLAKDGFRLKHVSGYHTYN